MGKINITPLADRTLRAGVVESLTKAIVSGNIPPGTKLIESSLAESLGISRGPLREAIRELVEQGLVVNVPYIGNFTSKITVQQIQEIYSFRMVLERFAFTLVWDKRDAFFIENLDEAHKKLTRAIDDKESELAIKEELNLHSIAYNFSGHSLLKESWEKLRGRLHYYFSLHQQAHKRPGPARDAHNKYVTLAKGSCLNTMLEHIDDHMKQGLDLVISFVKEIPPH